MKSIKEMLQETNLDWKVRTEPIQTVSGIPIEDRLAIIREDNLSALGVHSKGYVPYQNEELLELLFRISAQTGLNIHTGGSFKGGEKVYVQLKSDDMALNGDKIEGYISGFNSFDGRTALAFGNSNITVSCMNTFWAGYHNVDTKLRHSASMKPKIEDILRNIDALLLDEKQTFQKIRQMSEVKLDDNVRDLVIRKLFDISREEQLDSPDLSTNKKNKLDRFYIDLKGELEQKGDTLWGMFSGVTKYTTHSMKKTDNSESKIFGATGVKERKIFRELAEMV